MKDLERLVFNILKSFERIKFTHNDVEYLCMKRHNTLLSAQRSPNGVYCSQLHCHVYEGGCLPYIHINRPRDRQSKELLEELGWRES